jgi:hypothetical protein
VALHEIVEGVQGELVGDHALEAASTSRANLGAFALELRIRLGGPASHEMRFEVGLFKDPPEMLSTMPGLTASRASSLWLQ